LNLLIQAKDTKEHSINRIINKVIKNM